MIMYICIAVSIVLVVMAIKILVTYNHHTRICWAIYKYHMYCFHNDINSCVSYADVEDYNKTLLRLWDWGYKRILTKEKFEILKPFIKKNNIGVNSNERV